jgi:hypothetical protein
MELSSSRTINNTSCHSSQGSRNAVGEFVGPSAIKHGVRIQDLDAGDGEKSRNAGSTCPRFSHLLNRTNQTRTHIPPRLAT